MISANTKRRFDFAEQIQCAITSLDTVLSILYKEPQTEDRQLAKIVQQIGTVKTRLSFVLDCDSCDLSTTIASCTAMLDDSIRLVKKAPVVSLRQAQFVQSLYHIQSLLYPLMTNKHSNLKTPPPLPSSTKDEAKPCDKVPSAGINRRQHKRVPLETDVDFVGDTNFYTGFVEDISSGGLYVSTFNLQPIGTRVELSFTLPNGHQIKVPGQVRWVRDPIDPDDHSSPGMGIMFEAIDVEDKKQIDDFIEARSPLFYDEDL